MTFGGCDALRFTYGMFLALDLLYEALLLLRECGREFREVGRLRVVDFDLFFLDLGLNWRNDDVRGDLEFGLIAYSYGECR